MLNPLYLEWEAKLAKFTVEATAAFTGGHIDEQELGRRILEWKTKNPAPVKILPDPPNPPNPPKPKLPPKPPKPPLGNMNNFLEARRFESACGAGRVFKRSRGIITLGALVATAPVSLTAVASAALAYVVEEAATEAIFYAVDVSSTAFREASTPSTLAECHIQYNNFVFQSGMSTYSAKTGLRPAVLSEKDWFETTYGIRYDILK